MYVEIWEVRARVFVEPFIRIWQRDDISIRRVSLTHFDQDEGEIKIIEGKDNCVAHFKRWDPQSDTSFLLEAETASDSCFVGIEPETRSIDFGHPSSDEKYRGLEYAAIPAWVGDFVDEIIVDRQEIKSVWIGPSEGAIEELAGNAVDAFRAGRMTMNELIRAD